MNKNYAKYVGFYCLLCWAGWTVSKVRCAESAPELARANQSTSRSQTAGQRLATNSPTSVTSQALDRAVESIAHTNLVLIRPGTFRMGSPTNEVDQSPGESPQRAVTIRYAFWLGKYPVTQREYLTVMGSNPSHFTPNQGHAPDLNRPVETVNWYDAQDYCSRLTQRERAAGRITANSVYRLPTEAEWEYACRAGTSTRFSYGDDPGYTNLTQYAWYRNNSGGTTHPVGQKQPNPWGLYEMHGHVFEWCQDQYAPYPGGKSQVRSSGSQIRVFRGGMWDGMADYCRSAHRGHSVASGRTFYVGFRVVLVPGE